MTMKLQDVFSRIVFRFNEGQGDLALLKENFADVTMKFAMKADFYERKIR